MSTVIYSITSLLSLKQLYFQVVLCENPKFWIESNSYFSIRFDSKRAQLFEIFKYLPSPISYLFNTMTPIFTLANTPSNQRNLLLTMVQVPLKSLHWPSKHANWDNHNSADVRCHKNSWIYSTSTYYWWLLRPTTTIRLDSKCQIIAQLFDSIRNEKNTIRTALFSRLCKSIITTSNFITLQSVTWEANLTL